MPDLLQVCFEERIAMTEIQLDDPVCVELISSFFDASLYDEEDFCPTLEDIDACYDNIRDAFTVLFADCVDSDQVEGEKCLTREKYARAITRVIVTDGTVFNIHCVEASIHEAVVFYTAFLEVAGCERLVDSFADGPYSDAELAGVPPGSLEPGFSFPPLPFALPSVPLAPGPNTLIGLLIELSAADGE